MVVIGKEGLMKRGEKEERELLAAFLVLSVCPRDCRLFEKYVSVEGKKLSLARGLAHLLPRFFLPSNRARGLELNGR